MRFVQMLGTVSAFVLSVAVASSALAQAKTYEITEGKVQFVSKAPLEEFTGLNQKVSGSVILDAAKPAEAKGDVHVRIADTGFKTNIELRDEHLQSDSWLDAAKFPVATFKLTKVSGVTALKEGETVEVTVSGKLKLHGVERDLTAKATVRLAGGGLYVKTSFPVKLEDFGVSIPSIVALKVAPIVTANVNFTAKTK
jgi:polyisoprenoid-binding protein YceI